MNPETLQEQSQLLTERLADLITQWISETHQNHEIQMQVAVVLASISGVMLAAHATAINSGLQENDLSGFFLMYRAQIEDNLQKLKSQTDSQPGIRTFFGHPIVGH